MLPLWQGRKRESTSVFFLQFALLAIVDSAFFQQLMNPPDIAFVKFRHRAEGELARSKLSGTALRGNVLKVCLLESFPVRTF